MFVKRGRGRPKGRKDSKPRRRVHTPAGERELISSPVPVEEKLRRLARPQRLKVYAEITGLSVGLLRKKIEQGKIRAFHRSGMLLVEPSDMLAYWTGGRL